MTIEHPTPVVVRAGRHQALWVVVRLIGSVDWGEVRRLCVEVSGHPSVQREAWAEAPQRREWPGREGAKP